MCRKFVFRLEHCVRGLIHKCLLTDRWIDDFKYLAYFYPLVIRRWYNYHIVFILPVTSHTKRLIQSHPYHHKLIVQYAKNQNTVVNQGDIHTLVQYAFR